MNIKLKAGLEVAGLIVSAIVIGVVGRLGLNYLAGVYGTGQVVNGIIFAGISCTTIFMLKILYDIRVGQLEYRNKLNEMVKK
jgi:uncharacterized membrane protein YuzA (DUF378 family)